MIAIGTAFGARAGSATVEPSRLVSEWDLSIEHSLQISVRIGDTLHVRQGTVWLGAESPAAPITLFEGDTYTATSDTVLQVIGVDDPRVAVHSGRPVMVSTRADYGAWRHRSLP